MEHKCNDNKMRDLLHGYELGMLSDQEKDAFEAHLLECDWCFQQVKEFAPRGAMLTGAAKINIQPEGSADEDEQVSFWKTVTRALWPEGVPMLLRPAVLTAVLLIMLYPTYLGFRGDKEDSVGTVQEIALVQARSKESFVVRQGQTVVLSFLCPSIEPGTRRSVILEEYNGPTVYESDDFVQVDRYGVSRLLIPGELVSEGTFRLSVRLTGQTADEPTEIEYIFDIVHSLTSD